MAVSGNTRFSALKAVDSKALRTASRADFVYSTLRDAIAEGHLGGGERIRENEIANLLGVSRTPVREALQRLQQRGLLGGGPGRGGLVVAELNGQQVLELYAMREILEGSAARFAARHATELEIELLYNLQRELAQADDDPLTLVKFNRQFHDAVYLASHNRYLMEALDTLNDSFALLYSSTFRVPKRRSETDEEHANIVMAIEKHDTDAAEQAARHHIRQAQRTRFESIAILKS
jgi:DNA-binding GntR family transcriptional regulator